MFKPHVRAGAEWPTERHRQRVAAVEHSGNADEDGDHRYILEHALRLDAVLRDARAHPETPDQHPKDEPRRLTGSVRIVVRVAKGRAAY